MPARTRRTGTTARWPAVPARNADPAARQLASFTAHDGPEPLPAFALEPHHLQLFDGSEIVRICLDAGSRKIDADLEIEIGGLLHDILAGQVVAALAQHLFKTLGNAIAEDGRGVVEIALRLPFGHEGPPFIHGRIVLPFCVLIYLLNGLDRSNLGNAQTGGFTKDLGIPADTINTATSLFFCTV